VQVDLVEAHHLGVLIISSMNLRKFIANLRQPEISRDFKWSATRGLTLSFAIGVVSAAAMYPLIGAWTDLISFGVGIFVSTALLLYLFRSPTESDGRSRIKRFLAWMGVFLS